MKILVVGGGGREHALVWRLAQSRRVSHLYAAPGNPGMREQAECVDLSASDLPALADFAEKNGIDLTVVGPEAPLVAGIAELFQQRGLRLFGPKKDAARLEGSKVFCKQLLRKHGLPTADARIFDRPEAALDCVRNSPYPVVVKADGLAGGKGAFVCSELVQAEEAVRRCMVEKELGEAGNQILVEEHLFGRELSVFALTDSETILVLETAQDYKRLRDGDKGPNTGGMGSYSPASALSAETLQQIDREILVPIVHALKREGCEYVGVLYAGLMLTEGGPKVLEFNVRMGDPETQPLVVRMQGDLAEIMEACVDRRLCETEMKWDPRPSVCVVMASEGYPGRVEKGRPIQGLLRARELPEVVVFHAGTGLREGELVTAGGRVLGVTALGDTIQQACDRAYEAVRSIHFEGQQYRTDIAWQALRGPQ